MTKFDPVSFARKNISFHTGRDMPEDFKKINYIIRKDGLWEVRENKIGTFYVHLFEGNISGFGDEDETFEEGFHLSLPKIPRTLFNQVLAFFRKLCEDHDFEAYAQFYWDPEDEEYWIRVPQQKVSKGRVVYEKQEGVPSSNILVCEIHSHNSMNAFFSGIDDIDEKQRGDRFFGVIGRLDTKFPEIKMSFIIGGGKRVSVELDDVFEDTDFPEEWLENVVYVDHDENSELSQHQYTAEDMRRVNARRFFQEDHPMEGEEDEAAHWLKIQEEMEGKMATGGEDVFDQMEMTSISNEEELSSWVDGDDPDVAG